MPPQTSQNPGFNNIASDGTPLDPTAANLARSIREVESNHDFSAVGDGGQSHGAYQFNKDNFTNLAKQYNLDPNDFSPVNQDKVAYHRIKDLLDQGHSQSEIAAIWNGAHIENGKYVANNPDYVEKVKNTYQRNLTGTYVPLPSLSQQQGTPIEQPQQDQTLGEQITQRGSEFGTAAGQVISGLSGQNAIRNIPEGLLRAGGAIGGAVGDITTKALELIPGVKSLEGLIGVGVGGLAQTDTGKAVINEIQKFSQENPELAKDIGAGFNIATAIPIFKGLGTIKTAVFDAASIGLKNYAEKAATNDLGEVLSRTIRGRAAASATPDALSTLIENRAIPQIENGKYLVQEPFDTMEKAITDAHSQTTSLIQKANSAGIKPTVDVQSIRNAALESATSELEGQANYDSVINKINKMFDSAENSKRTITSQGEKYLELEDANFFKQQARKGLVWDDTVGRDAGYHVGQAYMKAIEDSAAQNGLGDVRMANQATKKLIEAQNLLKYIDGKSVKPSDILGKAAKLGKRLGIPFSGAVEQLDKQSAVQGILRRTGVGAQRQPLSILRQKTEGLIGSAMAQKASR